MKLFFLFFLFLFLNISCVKDIDVAQVETATFSTPMSLAMLEMKLTQHDFLDSDFNEIPQVEQLSIINISDLFKESITTELDYVTQYSNSFDRDFYCRYEFRDVDSVLIPIQSPRFFLLPANSNFVTDTITYEGEDFYNFLETRWITVKVDLEDGLPIIPTEQDSIKVQSIIHFDYIIAP